MITIYQRHRQTDRGTTCGQKTALCTKVHCAVIYRPIISGAQCTVAYTTKIWVGYGPPGLICSAAHGFGERYTLPQLDPGRSPTAVAFCCIVCSQNASGCSIFGYLVSIAVRGKMKANLGSGRIWYMLATYAI